MISVSEEDDEREHRIHGESVCFLKTIFGNDHKGGI